MKLNQLMDRLIGVIAVLGLAGIALLVLAPFLTALLAGAILAYCTWRPFERLADMLGERRVWAALLIGLFIACLLLGPVFYAGFAFFTHAPDIVESVQRYFAGGLPPLPDWLIQIPFVGPRLDEAWKVLAGRHPEMLQRLRELAGPAFRLVLHASLAVGNGLGMLALSLVFALFFYLGGERAVGYLQAVMRRIAGERGPELLSLVGGTVKGVVHGILGTSFAQAVLCAAGYWIAGLPSPALLGLATFFLAIVPGGPLLIVVPGAIWLAANDSGGWALFLAAWAGVASIAVDNVLKPMLIGRSSHVPFMLIMLGVLGGAVAFGFLGVFIGPTVLAAARAVLIDWVGKPIADPEDEARHRRARHVHAGLADKTKVQFPGRRGRRNLARLRQ